MTRAELLRLIGRHDVRRHPTLGRVDRKASEPTMAPTNGLTPAITVPGPKTYLHREGDRIAFAEWSDSRPRVPVIWVSYAAWKQKCPAIVQENVDQP